MIQQAAEVSGEPLPGMPLAGRLALSAAALLFLTWAYRYYTSRRGAAAAAGAQGGGGPGEGAGPKEDLPCARAGSAEAPEGARGRRAHSKRVALHGRQPCPAAHRAGPAAAALGKGRPPAGAPVGRELDVLTGEEEETDCPEIRLQPEQTCSRPEEAAAAGEASSCTLSDRSRARTRGGGSAAGSGGGPPSAAPPLSRSSGFHSAACSPERPSQAEAESARRELCLAPQGSRAGPAPLPASGEGAASRRGNGQLWGESVLPIQQPLAGQERVPVSRATSSLGLTLTQSDVQPSTTHTVSSVAAVRVEEGAIQPRRAQEAARSGQSGFPATHLRGKVHDYCVQSTSTSVRKEKATSTPQGTQSSDIPHSGEVQLRQEPAHKSAGESGTALEDTAPPPSGAPATRDDGQRTRPEDRKEAAREPAASQRPPGAGRTFRRKESFHKIVENPELQVPMESFGSPAPSGSSSKGETPPLGRHSSSVASLVGSMQSRPADASEKPSVEFVAGANFFHVPLSATSAIAVHVDLGNCYEALCVAKKQKLEGLREAALKVMSDNYLQVLRTSAIYGRLNALERDLILQRRGRGRKCVTVADVSSPDHPASRLCYYDDQADAWHPLTRMPAEAVSQGCAMCSMFNYLFVVAGCEGRGRAQKPSRRVFCYNPLTNIWREVCPLNQARPQCKLVALDGCLYAIGGECLYTVERYDPRLDRWTFASPLPNDTFAVAHTAAACDGEIYVTGGTLRYMLLKYSGRTDTWKVTLTGGSKDRTTEMVTASGFLYRFDLNRQMGISVYRCSSKAKLWYECATRPLPFPACFHCAVVDNLVHCVSRQFHLRFLADHVSPRFGTKELQHFPSPRGTLFPVTLVLPEREAAQTRV